mmetsp:Transcript_78159/g.253671  ORF Transcript_78159/g.253671 Transcript_78159/m.253671 type:complete len:288 (+) Transcript_78159:1558-2421(+)
MAVMMAMVTPSATFRDKGANPKPPLPPPPAPATPAVAAPSPRLASASRGQARKIRSWRPAGSNQSLPCFAILRRCTVNRRLTLTNSTPTKPHSSPMIKKAAISQLCHSFLGLWVDVDRLNSVRRFAPDKFKCFSVKLAEIAAVKAKSSERRPSTRTEPSSSATNSTPPSGAPNAVETPAAAPAHAKSCSGSALLPGSRNARTRRARAWAQQTPMWISGPSLPSDSPAPTVSESPRVLMSKQAPEKDWGKSKPDTAAFTSGMPLPRAAGQNSCTNKAATPVSTTDCSM